MPQPEHASFTTYKRMTCRKRSHTLANMDNDVRSLSLPTSMVAYLAKLAAPLLCHQLLHATLPDRL